MLKVEGLGHARFRNSHILQDHGKNRMSVGGTHHHHCNGWTIQFSRRFQNLLMEVLEAAVADIEVAAEQETTQLGVLTTMCRVLATPSFEVAVQSALWDSGMRSGADRAVYGDFLNAVINKLVLRSAAPGAQYAVFLREVMNQLPL